MSVYRSADDAVVRLGALVRRRAELGRRLAVLEPMRRRLDGEVREHEDAFDAEQQDVERLERGGLGRLLGAALGRGRLDEERAEAARAEFLLHAKRVELESVVAELEEVRLEFDALADVDADYRRAFEIKVAHLLQTSSRDAASVRALIQEVSRAAHQMLQIDELLADGRELRDNLNRLRAAITRHESHNTGMRFRVWHAARNRSLAVKLQWVQGQAHSYVRGLEALPTPASPWPADVLVAFSKLAARGRMVSRRPVTAIIAAVQRQLHASQRQVRAYRAGVRAAHDDAAQRYTRAVERA